jgi:hypothetical protein
MFFNIKQKTSRLTFIKNNTLNIQWSENKGISEEDVKKRGSLVSQF